MSLTIKDLSEKEIVQRQLNIHSIPIEAFLRLGFFKKDKADKGKITLYMKRWKSPIERIPIDNYKIGKIFIY